jgi:hypothetical protein
MKRVIYPVAFGLLILLSATTWGGVFNRPNRSYALAPQNGTYLAMRPGLAGRPFRARAAHMPIQSAPVQVAQAPAAPKPEPAKAPTKEAAAVWKSLFDGKSLIGWKKTEFGGEGEVAVENGAILLDMGSPLTGVTFIDGKSLPKTNYEIRLEARKTAGSDFFCGLTFPVADSHASFIVGGWGGGLVGISSIDGNDAARNDTATYHTFKDNQWYKLRVRVQPEKISCWIDDKQVVDRDIKGYKISTRGEVDLSKPLGISSFETKAELRKIEIRRLDAR